MANPEKGAARPLWLAVGVLTCVIFGTTLNKCLTCGLSVNPDPTASAPAPVVRGEPIFTTEATTPPRAAELVAAPDPGTAATPAPTSAGDDEGDDPTNDLPTIEPGPPLKPLPKAEEATAPEDLREYVDLGFDKLTSYVYELPEPGTEQKRDQIPASVKKLDGTKVSLKGFMIPLKTEGEDVIEFVLVRNQMACCFGMVPRINEWIHVRMAPGKAAPYALDIPITVFGKLEVGEVYENGYVMSVYRLECDRVVEPPIYR